MASRNARISSIFRRHRLARLVGALLLTLSIAGCSGTQQKLDQMLGAAPPPPTATPTRAAKTTRHVYYASADGTKVYAQPSGSSNVVGSLSSNEKVIRTKVDRGYALVESTKTGVKGWVDNARLTWKAPGAQPGGAPAAPGVAAAPDAPVEEPEADEEEEESAPAPMPTTAPAVAPTRKPTPEGVGPSIFNPY